MHGDSARDGRDTLTIGFAMLGEIQAHRDGITVNLGPTRQRTVLAALLMDVNRVVPMEGLADRVWGAHVPQRVGGAVQLSVPAAAGAGHRAG